MKKNNLRKNLYLNNIMGNSFGLGGLGWFFVPGPLAKPAFIARSAQVTLSSAQNVRFLQY